MCLFYLLGIFGLLSSLFRREGLDLEGLSLRERMFNLRERLDMKALGGRLGGLRRRVDNIPWEESFLSERTPK